MITIGPVFKYALVQMLEGCFHSANQVFYGCMGAVHILKGSENGTFPSPKLLFGLVKDEGE
jgi:hypothetical protein